MCFGLMKSLNRGLSKKRKNNAQIKKLFEEGIFEELINFNYGSEGPIIKNAMGFVPEFNNLINEKIKLLICK